MTSNIGAELIKNQAGFGFQKRSEDNDYEKMKELLKKEVERYFRPEFINRLDDLIVFRSLSREDLHSIIDLELAKVFERVDKQGLKIKINEQAKEFLIEKGYDPDFGARPLRRAIERFVEDPLSEAILRQKFKESTVIQVIRKDDKLAFIPEDLADKEKDQPAEISHTT